MSRKIWVGPCTAERLDTLIGDSHAGHVEPFGLLVGTEHIYVNRIDTAHLSDQDVRLAVLAYWAEREEVS